MTVHQHHKIDCHVDYVIERTKSASHAIVKLKWSGVDPFRPKSILQDKGSIYVLPYAVFLWYPHVTDKYKKKLEIHQQYCTRPMLDDEDDYETGFSILKLDKVNVRLQIFCFVAKVL